MAARSRTEAGMRVEMKKNRQYICTYIKGEGRNRYQGMPWNGMSSGKEGVFDRNFSDGATLYSRCNLAVLEGRHEMFGL